MNPDPLSVHELDFRLRRATMLGRSRGTRSGVTAARKSVEIGSMVIGATVSLATLSVLIALLMIVSAVVVAYLPRLLTQYGPGFSTWGLLGGLALIRRHCRRPRLSGATTLGRATMQCGREAAGGNP
jgi:hypothetical protein